MPLTNGHDVFASLNESGINKFLRNLALARPHDFHFATAALGGGSTAVTLLPALTIPGAGFGIDYAIELATPIVDFFPPTQPLPSPLALGFDQFSLTVAARICIVCGEARGKETPSRGRNGPGKLICATL